MTIPAAAHEAVYYFRHRSCDLEGRLIGDSMLVKAESSAREDSRPGASDSINYRRNRLLAEGIARIEAGRFVLTQDHMFATPSQAVDVMNGGHVRNPLKLWRDTNGRSLQELQQSF